MQSLKINSTLQGGKYKIIAMLGQGGFGITYLAENTMLDGKVAIKEFFFKDYCNRDEETSHVTIPTEGNREIVERFKTKFIKEARTIFKLNHPNIVRILDIFEENGTAFSPSHPKAMSMRWPQPSISCSRASRRLRP